MVKSLIEYFGSSGPPAEKVKPPVGTSLDKYFGSGTHQELQQQEALRSLYVPYRRVLGDYDYHPQRRVWKFFNGSPNIGYKFHLNVDPSHVKKVAAFLKTNDYEHKYLSGGEVESGKIFTVYTGSKAQTEQIVREVADGVGGLLLPSLAGGETVYAHNIVGRFVGDNQSFLTKYAVNGITILRHTDFLDPQIAFTQAHTKLQDKYGEYYGGGITYYVPQRK